LAAAIDQVDAWLESPSLTLLTESEGYWRELKSMMRGGRIAGPHVHDARVAALCRLHGVRELWTADRDFSRFRGLEFRNPLVEAVHAHVAGKSRQPHHIASGARNA
jgi:predicted nucleic acid-binding protein